MILYIIRFKDLMQSKSHRKFIGVILASDMGNELFPLVHNFPMSNLAVGNKKLIIYQLQQLESIEDISTIIVVYSQDSVKVKQYLETQFVPNHPQYPHHITFFRVENKQSEYTTLQKLLNSNLCEGFENTKGILFVPPNIVSSIKFSTVLDEHKQKKSDVTLLLKQKKQFGKDEKKPDVDFEPQIDIALYNQAGEVFALSDIQNYDYSGFNLNSSVYHRISRASFQKVVDSRVYVFSQRIIKIIKNLINSELAFIKIDLIDMLIRNQTNSTLLNVIGEENLRPLRIIAKITNQNEYIRRITNVKIYESVNLDSLIKGPKQKDVLMPNSYTEQIDQKAMHEYKGCLVGSKCTIDSGNKLMRNIIENGCRIGRNVEMNNSIIMAGTVIEDGCKIIGSSIGPNCTIKAQSIISFCQLAMGCVVEKGSNFQKQPMIPTE